MSIESYHGSTTAKSLRFCSIPEENLVRLISMVTSGKVQVSPLVLTRFMSWFREAIEEMNHLGPEMRIILTADDFGFDFNPEAKSCR